MEKEIYIFHTEFDESVNRGINQKTIDKCLKMGLDRSFSIEEHETSQKKRVSFFSKLILGNILEQEFGVTKPLQGLKYQAKGKPFLLNSKWKFNLSHSGSQLAIALTEDWELGVDIQKIKRVSEGVVKRISSPEESQHYNLALNKQEAFFEMWTKKEAAVKQIGEGIQLGLSSFSTLGNTTEIRNKKLVLQNLDIHPNYKAALAFESQDQAAEIKLIKL